MKRRRRFWNDKTVMAAVAVTVVALSAIMAGAFFSKPKNNSKEDIVDLNETENAAELHSHASTDKNGDKKNNENNSTDKQTAEENRESTGKEQQNREAGPKDDTKETVTEEREQLSNTQEQPVADVSSGSVSVGFNVNSTLKWPVEGRVIREFNMENTVYFPTLDLYKCSDSVIIQAQEGTPVYAGYDCKVTGVAHDGEIGNNVTVDLGNNYILIYGQLKDIQTEPGKNLRQGDLIGYVAEPTKYYSVEGSNLYLKLMENGVAVDPLDYLNY